MNKIKARILYAATVLCMAVALVSCSENLDIPLHGQRESGEKRDSARNTSEETRRTFLLYLAGYNNLTSYMLKNIEDLCSGYLPEDERYEDQIFIFSHLTAKSYDYKTPATPYLLKIYKDNNGICHTDTLVTYPEDTRSSSAETLGQVIGYIDANYKAKEFGMLFSSHATGWLPENIYGSGTTLRSFSQSYDRPRPAAELAIWPDVKSIGAEFIGSSRNSLEMNLQDFADCIPTRLDYIIFDACLMGGIEVAYELKDVCDKLVFSQNQVLASGFVYTSIASRLLEEKPADVVGVAEDFFNYYDTQSGNYRSATVSVIDCTGLDELADVCSGIFNAHRQKIGGINPLDVQRMDYSSSWFYDFADIFNHLPLEDDEKAALEAALGKCVLYKAATPEFFGIETKIHSGFSMYLQNAGNATLDGYYADLEWNRKTNYIISK